jgi:glutamate/tyrosine decarboxylase-like PLP-dependent enzyme
VNKTPHENYRAILPNSAERALRYLENINDRRVFPAQEALAGLARLGGTVPEKPEDMAAIIQLLDEVGSPATVATTGGRYFGFVVGGALPATVAAHWLADAWDQNACLHALSPVAAYLEEVVLRWLLDLLGLPAECGGAFVTGAQMANFTCLAAARHAVLEQAGWNVELDGLNGAPPITVVVGEEVHATVLKALSLLGLGRNRVMRVPADAQGRMRPDAIPMIQAPAIICVQAGNVNTGAFDPLESICEFAQEHRAWVHVDGAFGLWAALSDNRKHLLKGVASADSWAADAHKWLNVPQDSGIAIVKDSGALRAAMTIKAAYLNSTDGREPMQWTPESSRRARAVEIWAAIRSLGREGLSELIERNCRQAVMFADGFRRAGFEVLNDVVLNQVLVSFGTRDINRIIKAVQADGTCWCGSTVWHGRPAMRISVSSWATTENDVERSLAALLSIAAGI